MQWVQANIVKNQVLNGHLFKFLLKISQQSLELVRNHDIFAFKFGATSFGNLKELDGKIHWKELLVFQRQSGHVEFGKVTCLIVWASKPS